MCAIRENNFENGIFEFLNGVLNIRSMQFTSSIWLQNFY